MGKWEAVKGKFYFFCSVIVGSVLHPIACRLKRSLPHSCLATGYRIYIKDGKGREQKPNIKREI